MIRDFFMGFLMIFYIFMKLIFSAKNERTRHLPILSTVCSANKRVKNRHLNSGKKDACNLFRFLFKSFRHCVRNNRKFVRDFNGFSVKFCCSSLSADHITGARTLRVSPKPSMGRRQFYINLPRCPVERWEIHLLTRPRLPNGQKMNYSFRFLFLDSPSVDKSHLIETLILVIAL